MIMSIVFGVVQAEAKQVAIQGEGMWGGGSGYAL